MKDCEILTSAKTNTMFALSQSLQNALTFLSKSVGMALVTFKMCGMRSDTATLLFSKIITIYYVLFFSGQILLKSILLLQYFQFNTTL